MKKKQQQALSEKVGVTGEEKNNVETLQKRASRFLSKK